MRIAIMPILFLALAAPALAQSPAPAKDEAKSSEPYHPGLGEIMTLQQMRHLKLWFAGQARNWDLAAYEVDELKEGFEDVAKYFPTREEVPLGQMVKTITDTTVADLEKAIAARNGKAFASAFDALTQSCNACHQAAKHGFIAIQRPKQNPYANQSFAPVR
jgi:hypothetical protein